MNDVMRGAALPPEYSQLLADFPRFSADIMPHNGAAEWHLSTEAVAAGIEAGRRLFPMPEVEVDTRFQAQLWWWSMCGALVGPSLACVLVSDRVPVWQWSSWFTFLRDDYWVGFQAQQFESISAEDADELKDSGEALAHFLEPLAQVVGEVGEIKPAPLWAVAADAVANAAISAGNELMEPWRGALIGKHVVEGIQRVHRVPLPRFVDSCGGEVRPWDEAAAESGEESDFDVVTHLERATCCMIYHSPDADLCVSCPKRSREERHQLWARY
ncbi:(2Fe-2S)-binding protein [Corynebacterium amycolatum]|uniref:(2Fe-2S)-binding protein n=1 Tax=Corynebacterium amycolatum TaxID=43765 RepID=UPI0012B96B81|nr:(2Fe-2S)-binding protein [Corynebacterium amycolatum]KAA9270016.1 (2Fe-2S)-binding protein [Corynebacterium amycolatum]MBU5623308.1 (2Fe-2S)-binding protein [Corynebacterium amycolatum]